MRAVLKRRRIEIPENFRFRTTTRCLDFISDYAEPGRMTTTQLRKAIRILSKSKDDVRLILKQPDVNLSGTKVVIPGSGDIEAEEEDETSSSGYHRSLVSRFTEPVREIDDELERLPIE